MSIGRVEQWENQFAGIGSELDDYFEDKYGDLYPVHPARPKRDSTANKQYSGLFSIVSKFTAGYGSEHGSGYLLDVRLSTLATVPREVRAKIEDEVAEKLKELLARDFPDLTLRVERDGPTYKIFGDLSLGSL
jgi:hypothetical protein